MIPSISVLMPAHNSGPFLRPAVESILRQTSADWELIVVDDASTDDTPAVLASFRDPRLIWLRNSTNQGQARSLNRGLGAARGRYIACLDHDDIAEPERLARQAAYLDARPDVTLLGTWATVIDLAGHPVGTSRPPSASAVIAWALAGGCPLIHSSVMYRRDEVLALGGYDPAFGLALDYDLWTRIVQAGHRAAGLPRRLCRVRRHATQLSRVRAEAQNQAAIAIAGRYVCWLLDEPVAIEQVQGLMSLCHTRHPDWRILGRDPRFAGYVALLERVTVCCQRRFTRASGVRGRAVALLLKSATATLADAFRMRGARRRMLSRGGSAALAACRLACR